ncbi:unnamed protein product (macronuclear) [Paramecium tetraurelia]|uniref:Uncharacterized protein n=1 Tax=Paramecium tetraurelia TaxID=5888 RepID=A0DMW8_PARTE|nr:uncharacterized protein GSPATT00018590001 [Paramecium tetraurelia]CAK84385.1 unnamed protein product [Paramecium tetraurelia]|eukprot:XP_001451782.1 hypothetical protein (macronuclear) [Paramecium tetraurelia strain d4-2]
MNPSLKLKTQQSTKTFHQKDSPKMKRTQSNYLLPSKSQGQKLKTTGYGNDQIRLNNSINYLQENTKTFCTSICIPYKTEETENKNEINIKQQLIIELNKKNSQLQINNQVLQQSNKQMQDDILILNQTIEQICNRLSKQKEQSENLTSQINDLQNTVSLQKQEISKFKNENFKLMTVLKIGKQKNGKENNPELIQHNYQEQINLLKEQISIQKQVFQQTESTLQKQIKKITSFFNKFFLSNNNLNLSNTKKIFSQNENDTIQLLFDDDESEANDPKYILCQTIQNQTEKQQNSVVENTNLSNTKEISKLKQILQIQKLQIERQQKTILNQHFEIQNLQNLMYKQDYESIAEFNRNSVNNNDQFATQQFANSPNDEMCYHLNDSQCDIKPQCFLDSMQNTLQKFQVITEEGTFRN